MTDRRNRALLRQDKFLKESMQVRLIKKSHEPDGELTSVAVKTSNTLIF